MVLARAFGEGSELVARLVTAHIRGVQASGLIAANARFFRGDGFDKRDLHYATSINAQSRDQ
jgi:beta-glucosidase-like glycosyl hydrolase